MLKLKSLSTSPSLVKIPTSVWVPNLGSTSSSTGAHDRDEVNRFSAKRLLWKPHAYNFFQDSILNLQRQALEPREVVGLDHYCD